MSLIYRNQFGAYMEVIDRQGSFEYRIAPNLQELRYRLFHYDPQNPLTSMIAGLEWKGLDKLAGRKAE